MRILYRGTVNAWECDEMGHMNVRFYVAKALEGLGQIAAELGLGGAFRAHSAGTIAPVDQHIRFYRESRQGTPLTITGGLAAFGESDALLWQEVRHTHSGELSAAIRTRLSHVEARNGAPFPWPERARLAQSGLHAPCPEHTAARGLDFDPPRAPAPSAARAADLGLTPIGRFQVTPDQCDVFGRMRPEMVIGRISDSVPNLMEGWRRRLADTLPGAPRRIGAAVLESRLIYRKWPHSGDLIDVASAIRALTPKTSHFVHWLLDPLTGAAWASSAAIAVSFDLDARAAISVPEAALAELAPFLRAEIEL